MKIERKLVISFKDLVDMYDSIYLDIAFQRKGGWGNGSGWSAENYPDYINSILSDSYANTITMAKIKESHEYLLAKEDCTSLLEDIDYYRKLENLNKKYLSVDGWNTTSCIYNFVNNKFTIKSNGTDQFFKELHPSLQQKILCKEIGVQYVIGGTKNQVTKMFRKMNSSTALTAQERRQARFTHFAASIREMGEETISIFANWVYNDKKVLDQRKHEESLAILIQARRKNYNHMQAASLDDLYENVQFLPQQEIDDMNCVFQIMKDMSEQTGFINSKYRMTRADFIVFFLIIEHTLNQGFIIKNKKEFYEYYKMFVLFVKTETKDFIDAENYTKLCGNFYNGTYGKKMIDLNICHLNENFSVLEKDGIIEKKQIRNFSTLQKNKAYFAQNGFEPDGKKIPFSDLEKGLVEADHNIPYSKGGKTEEENLVVLTKDSNRKKSDIMPEHFWVSK